MPLEYDAVIATRNRPAALSLTIPLLISQSRPPARIIVIDSSDDHGPVADAVAKATLDWAGDVTVEHSGPGLPFQRNRGLSHVTAPIVLFPDDDSLLFPEAAKHLLDVYERDTEGRIAAVCAAEAMAPHPDMDLGDSAWMTQEHAREARFRRMRNRLEKRFTALKPQVYLGQLLAAQHALPDWCADMDVVAVEYMTGFRMSFRTDAIRPTGFDAVLGGYALDEDIDASFQAARHGAVVAARNAKIYHHRFPTGRGDGGRLGRMEVLNRIYVGLKHAHQPGLPAGTVTAMRRRLRGFIWLKLLTCLPKVRSEFGRDRLRGAWRARHAAHPLWRAAPDVLADAYKRAFEAATSRQ